MTMQKIKPLLFHLMNIAILYVATALFFGPLFQGKKMNAGDSIQSLTNRNEIYTYAEETGERVYWSNSMFGGMPDMSAYGMYNIYPGKVFRALDLCAPKPANLIFKSMLFGYLAFALMGVNIWLCLLGGLSLGLTTNYLVITEAGQYSKIACASFTPLIMAGVVLTFRQKYLLGGTILAFTSSMALFTRHPQMLYYLFLSLFIGGIVFFIKAIRDKELVPFGKSVGVLVLAGGLALLSGLSNIMAMRNYSEESMRGEPILEKQAEAVETSSSSEVEGLAWDYAMQWSNNTLDAFSILVPGVVGGSSAEPIDSDAASARLFQSPTNARAPLYWGGLPFTSGPQYFGAIIMLLFVLAMFLLPAHLRWWALGSLILMIFLSMGKNMESLSRFFFDNVPLYNKFRTPQSILVITSGIVIFFAILGGQAILDIPEKERKQALRKLYYASGGLAVVCLFFALVGPSFFDFTSAGDARYQAEVVNLFVQDRKDLMQSDAWRTFGFLVVGTAFIWAYLTDRVKPLLLTLGLTLFSTLDFWFVGRRYINPETFVNAQQYQQNFQPRPADQQIMQAEPQGRGYYRVLDLSINTFNSSSTSYFHNTIGGYSAVKLQRIQDVIDRHISQNNQQVLNMLNTKYIIGQEGQVQQNPNALGTAWFVQSIRPVDSPNEEISALSNFNPAQEAIVLTDEFSDYLSGFNAGNGQGTITLTDYKPNELTYQTNTSQEQLAVFSEIWYGPDKGWTVTLDGEEVDHIRANYLLRAMKVPAGEHTIHFEFDPSTIYGVQDVISRLSSGVILLLGIGLIGWNGYQWYQQPAPEPKPEPQKQGKKAKVARGNRKKKKK
jgi:hypothetical protein